MVDYNETVRQIRLRYVGQRFDGARMPLDVLPDLPAFRDLLAALLKDAWRNDNANRRRLPKGFDRSFTFDLAGIDDGSAIPVMEWNRDIAQENLPGMSDYLEGLAEVAMQQLLEIVDGSGNGRLPVTLPPEAIRAMNKFGSSLRPDERIEFEGSTDDNSNVVFIDAERRKRLITHVKETYDVRVDGVGTLHGLSLSGKIWVATDYGLVEVSVDPDEVAGIYDGNTNSFVQFDLTLELDHQDRIRGVTTVHEIDLVDEANAAALEAVFDRIDEISALENGWLDGSGERIAEISAETARRFVIRSLSMAPLMKAYPAEEGGVTIEMRNSSFSASIDFEPSGEIVLTAIGLEDRSEYDETHQEINSALLKSVDGLFGPKRQ